MAGSALATPIAVLSAAVSVVVADPPGRRARRSAPVRHAGDPSPGCPTPGRQAPMERAPPKSDRHTGWDHASVLVHVPAGGLTAHRNPWSSSPAIGTVAATSKYYGVPIVLWVDAVNADRHVGPGRAPLRVAAPRRLDPARSISRATRPSSTSTSTCPNIASASTSATSSCTRCPARSARRRPRRRPGHYVVTDRVPFPAGSALGIVRVRDQRDPAAPACRVERWEPARDPRHERTLVDRYERLGRLRPGERVGARAFRAAAAARHARRHPRVRR